jgi:hypothetical protein
MTDIVAAARAHIASLPPHLKDRYSATLISKLIAKVMLLEELRNQDGLVISLLAKDSQEMRELRKLDGESLGKSIEEYNKMKELCVNGRHITDEERLAVMSAVWDAENAGCPKDAAILLDMANRLSKDSPQLETDGERSRG